MKDYKVGSKQSIDVGEGFEVKGIVSNKRCITCAKMSVIKVTDFPDTTPNYCLNGCKVVEFIDLDVGNKVIVRSNNDDPLMIGTITGFEMGGKTTPSNHDIPYIKSDEDGKIYMCMGLVFYYSEDLLKEILNIPTPKEQWNYLANNYVRQ